MSQDIELLDEPQTTALTLPARAAVALGSDKARVELAALVAKSKDVQTISNGAGRDECHSYAMALVKARTTIKTISKDARDDAVKFGKAVIAEEAALIAITEPEEKRLMALRDAWDTKVAAEKEAKAAAERARLLAITDRIAKIKGYHALAIESRTADGVQRLLDKMTAEWTALDEDAFENAFEEFCNEAQAAFDETKQRMQAIIDSKRAEEVERAALKAKQEAEAAKVKAEQEAAADKLKAEREAFAAEQEAARLLAKAAEDKRNEEYARWGREQQAAREALEAKAAEVAAAAAKLVAEKQAIADAAKAKEEADRRAIAEQTEREEAARALADYEAAIAIDKATVAPVIDAAMTQIFGEVVDAEVPRAVTVVEPVKTPSAHALVEAVANTFSVDNLTAANWLYDRAAEIAIFE